MSTAEPSTDPSQASAMSLWGTILLADISGSTPLYGAIGNTEAQRLIRRDLVRLRTVINDQDGVHVRQKGDDALCYFDSPDKAFRATRTILSRPTSSGLSIHAGLHFGQFLMQDGDIFGDAVNLTARLAALANGGEALLSRTFSDQLPAHDIGLLQALGSIRLKGIDKPVEIFSLVDDEIAMRTQVVMRADATGDGWTGPPLPEIVIVLSQSEQTRSCREAESLMIGRSKECGVVLSAPYISRKHATVTVRDGKVTLEDRSASGTYVSIDGGQEFFLRRETILLTGNGTISPAVRVTQPDAVPIQFEIIQR